MSRLSVVLTIVLLLVLAGLLACAPDTQQRKPRLLIIGDSISMGYTDYLREQLPEFIVDRIPANAATAESTLARLETWGIDGYNVIIWNNGLWHTLNPHSTVDEYASTIAQIQTRLQQTGARVYFVETTVVPYPQRDLLDVGFELQLNQAAYDTLTVPIIALHNFSKQLPDSMRMYGYDIHYTDEGSAELAREIARQLRIDLL